MRCGVSGHVHSICNYIFRRKSVCFLNDTCVKGSILPCRWDDCQIVNKSQRGPFKYAAAELLFLVSVVTFGTKSCAPLLKTIVTFRYVSPNIIHSFKLNVSSSAIGDGGTAVHKDLRHGPLTSVRTGFFLFFFFGVENCGLTVCVFVRVPGAACLDSTLTGFWSERRYKNQNKQQPNAFEATITNQKQRAPENQGGERSHLVCADIVSI